MKKTHLYDTHLTCNARMASFHGYEMPLQYDSIINEHLCVRENAGLFDVSHMGRFAVSGDTAFPFIQQIITNDAGQLADKVIEKNLDWNELKTILQGLNFFLSSVKHFMLVVN